jgi:HEAT repeat protein
MAKKSLTQKGLLVFGLMLVVLTAVWIGPRLLDLMRRGAQQAPVEKMLAEQLLTQLSVPGATFPSALNWPALAALDDALPSDDGWKVRYQATRALARRGSKAVRLDVLREMLDEERQLRNGRVQQSDGRIVTDEADARRRVLIGLKTVVEWHKHTGAIAALGKAELESVYRAVEKLGQSDNIVVRKEAETTLATLGRK